MRRSILSLLVLAGLLASAPVHAETQAVAKQRIQRELTNYAHIPSGDVATTWKDLLYPLQYATAAELLAASPTEGAIGYAIDTNVFYLRSGGSWAAVGDTADPHVIATEAAVLASSPADGTLDFATDTTTFWFRSNSAWSVAITQSLINFAVNGGSISNATNNSLIFAENSENAIMAFTGNLVTFDSSTGATYAFTPTVSFTDDVSLAGGTAALGVAVPSTMLLSGTADNSATGWCIGSTGATSTWCMDSRNAAEGIVVTGYQKVSGAVYGDGGIDRSAGAALAIGATNATTVNIGATATPVAVTSAGAVTIPSTLAVTGMISGPKKLSTKTDDYQVVFATDCGSVILLGVDTKGLTMPNISAASAGCTVTLINTAATGNTSLVYVDVDGTDTIGGSCGAVNVSGTAGKRANNTKATHVIGDSITVVSDGTSAWYVTACTGIWAAE